MGINDISTYPSLHTHHFLKMFLDLRFIGLGRILPWIPCTLSRTAIAFICVAVDSLALHISTVSLNMLVSSEEEAAI